MPGSCGQESSQNRNTVLETAIPGAIRIVFSPGEYLFKQNDRSYDLFFILSGKVRIFKTEGDLDIELDRAGPGSVVGEVAFLDTGPRSASGVALVSTEVLCVPAHKQPLLMSAIPDWLSKIAIVLSKRLRDVGSKIDISLFGNKHAQVAALITLIAFSDYCEQGEEGFEIKLKFLENELVDILNLQFSEVEEELDLFVEQKLIRIERKRVILPSRDALKEIGSVAFRSHPQS
ncbi:MAG: Crp/Fnr family transcriptional regulator [Chitinispirillaceae bacterium]